jgi:hypothetical protein
MPNGDPITRCGACGVMFGTAGAFGHICFTPQIAVSTGASGNVLAPLPFKLVSADLLEAAHELTTLRTRTEKMEQALREIAEKDEPPCTMPHCSSGGRIAGRIAREALEKGE